MKENIKNNNQQMWTGKPSMKEMAEISRLNHLLHEPDGEVKKECVLEGLLTDHIPIHSRVHLVFKESVHAASLQLIPTAVFATVFEC